MRNRTFGINIRVTEKEKKRIEKYAKKCKLSVSEYLRQLANGYEPRIYESVLEEFPQSNQDLFCGEKEHLQRSESFDFFTESDEPSVMRHGNYENLAD